jgi:hypothetical protein
MLFKYRACSSSRSLSYSHDTEYLIEQHVREKGKKLLLYCKKRSRKYGNDACGIGITLKCILVLVYFVAGYDSKTKNIALPHKFNVSNGGL